MMKYDHVIPCPMNVCNLGYNKIVFDNGYVATVGTGSKSLVREYVTYSSVSEQVWQEWDNGETTLSNEWQLIHREENKLTIRYTSYCNIDKFGNYYKSSREFETSDLNWFTKHLK